MKKKLAIICASQWQIPMVNKAKEMGIETHCFAWDKGHYSVCKGIADYFHPISILEKEQILEVCKDLKIDGVTTVCDAYAVPTVAFIAENMGLVGNKYEDIMVTRNKYQARQALLKNGVSSPRFAVARKGEALPDLTEFKYPLIVKPTDRTASFGVMKVDTEKEFREALQHAQDTSYIGEAIIEEFVAGSEVSAHTISWNGNHYILAVRDKVTSGPPNFVEIAHHMPSQLSPEIIAKIEAEARKSLNALNIKNGACDAEFMITENGDVYAIEINSCWGGDKDYDMIYYSTGLDYMKMAINVALGHFEEPVVIPRYYTGVYFLSKEYAWIKEVIENKDSDPDIVEAEISREELLPLQSSADRSGYFIYKSDRKRTWGGF